MAKDGTRERRAQHGMRGVWQCAPLPRAAFLDAPPLVSQRPSPKTEGAARLLHLCLLVLAASLLFGCSYKARMRELTAPKVDCAQDEIEITDPTSTGHPVRYGSY